MSSAEPTPEAEVEIRIRNNVLKRQRVASGLTQAQLAQAIGLTAGCSVGQLETLQVHPKGRGRKNWTPTAKKLARYFGVELEILFPLWLYELHTPVAVKEMNAEAMYRLLSEPPTPQTLPDEAVQQIENMDTVKKVLATLTPREERVLRLRYGIGNEPEHSLEEVAEQFDQTRERIRQIEAKALRKLRHPSRAGQLLPGAYLARRESRRLKERFSIENLEQSWLAEWHDRPVTDHRTVGEFRDDWMTEGREYYEELAKRYEHDSSMRNHYTKRALLFGPPVERRGSYS